MKKVGRSRPLTKLRDIEKKVLKKQKDKEKRRSSASVKELPKGAGRRGQRQSKKKSDRNRGRPE